MRLLKISVSRIVLLPGFGRYMLDGVIANPQSSRFCSFKLKTTKESTFCRNEYNVRDTAFSR